MRLWADACVTPELEQVAHERGYEATSNRTRDMLDVLDPNLYPVVTDGDWVFVTNNERDFVELATLAGLHPGLICIPQGKVEQQRQWFDEIITYVEDHAGQDDEAPAAWMVCRVVMYDDGDNSIAHGWLPA